MSEETIIDKDYKDAFNLGYELARELNIKTQMFHDIGSANRRTNPTKDGIGQYIKEMVQLNSLKRIQTINSKIGGGDDKSRGEGFDLSI